MPEPFAAPRETPEAEQPTPVSPKPRSSSRSGVFVFFLTKHNRSESPKCDACLVNGDVLLLFDCNSSILEHRASTILLCTPQIARA